MIRLPDSVRALLAVASVFVVGVVAGCALDRTILAPPTDAVAAGTRQGGPRHHDQVLDELRAKLGLSAEQSTLVQKIFAAHQANVEAAWAEVHASLQRTLHGVTTEIEAVLDSTQIERLHVWLDARHARTPDHARGREH